MDMDDMSNRELLVALMRGSAKEYKQGYSLQAALRNVDDIRELGFCEESDLLSYGEGFIRGAREDYSRLQLSE